MLFLSNIWLNIDISFKYFIFVILKNFLSYNEELFLFSIYSLLFLIIVINSVQGAKKFLINSSLELLEFYEKLVYLKSYLLLLLKKNYLLSKKCEYIKLYLKNLFLKLFLKTSFFNKLIKNDYNLVYLSNYNNLFNKSNKLKLQLNK